MKPQNIDERLKMLSAHTRFDCGRLPAPRYEPRDGTRLYLAVKGFERHMTSESHQWQLGMAAAGYELHGHGYPAPRDNTHTPTILSRTKPSVVFMADRREWDPKSQCCLCPEAHFAEWQELGHHPEMFTVTVLKDAHQDGPWHRDTHRDAGVNAWVAYYHPRIVAHLSQWVRQEHILRAYHPISKDEIPPYSPGRSKHALVSGALGSVVYPLRTRMFKASKALGLDVAHHPGYHIRGTATPDYLKLLSQYCVSVCTSSIYGYALRKIIEATACGCVVITDLPTDDVLPEIDENLIRVHPRASLEELKVVINRAVKGYNASRQRAFAQRAIAYYDYEAQGRRLSSMIEDLRHQYRY